MNKKITLGLLLLTVVAIVGVPGALAYGTYVTPLNDLYGPGLSCGTCHVDPNGGGARNAYGQLFEGQTNHQSDSTAALKAIGAPPGATPTPVLTTIKVSPATATLDVNGTQAFTAMTLDQNNNTINATVIWSSSNTTVGTIDAAGSFMALAAGTTTITATNGTVSGTASITVNPANSSPGASILTTIKVLPATATLDVNGTQAFTATAYDQLGKLMDVIFSWNSSNTTVGTIDSTGLFTAKALGTTTITATSGDVNGTTSVSVSAAPTSSPPSSSPGDENHGHKYGKIHKHNHSKIHENGHNNVNETEHDEVEEDD
ncbi:Bacterial Ig-like domain (group 2) [uncultured archaeon]|nr:Bacterial Ig-like domain (group 2) [uncultured archaeon]